MSEEFTSIDNLNIENQSITDVSLTNISPDQIYSEPLLIEDILSDDTTLDPIPMCSPNISNITPFYKRGIDGLTLYVWIKFADTPTSGMSDIPTGKDYLGIAVNKPSQTESLVYSDYEWIKLSSSSGSPVIILRLDTWGDYTSDKAEWLLSALLGNELNTRVTNLESGVLTPDQLETLSFWKKDPNNPNTIFTEMNAYSKLELSAYGAGDGGGGGGSDYERLDTWASYDSSKAEWVLSAFLGNDLNTRVTDLENSAGGGGSTVEWGTLTNGYRQLTVEGVTYALAQNTHTHLWADITDKPSTFAPSAHTHAWGDITSKPSTFAPSAHTHLASDITSGTFAIARIPTGSTSSTVALGNHTHAWANITNKPSTFTPSAHTHLWADITDKPSTFTPSAHTHSAGDITSGTFAIGRIPTGTTSSTVALGNHLHTGVYEPVFSKNTAFNKNFGTDSGTVAQGNDSRINNGQTAYGWGNHASAGYALNSSLSNYVPTSRTITAGNGLTGGGTLAEDRTLTLGTPGTLTAETANGVTASSHTHAITTTSVGAANTIIQTDASGGTKLNNLLVGGNWKLEQVGTELQLKYNNVVAQRFLLDGSIVGLGEITAYGATTGGEGVALLRTGGTMTGDLVLDANLGIANKALTLLGNALTYNASNVLTEANTATQIKMGNGWTIEQTTSALTIKKNGVVKGSFNA